MAVSWSLVLVMLAVPAVASAQDRADRDADETVTAAITPYMWVTGFNGTIDVVDRVSVDAAPTGAFASSQFGSCAAFELRAGRAAVLIDMTFATLTDAATASAAPKLTVAVRSLTLGSLIGYRVVNAGRASLDLLVGVRIVRFGPSLGTTSSSQSADLTDTWAESIGGARVEFRGGDRWSFVVHVDAGGKGSDQFGSSLSWHAETLARWRLTDHLSVVGGYKHLYIRRHWEPLFFDGAEHGLSMGLLVDRFVRQ